ncbi:MAG: GIY-YIG nuclease family protein [Flavobacteriales bacterium]|nr:GIY-YIG nuclease family protein [Flavobacteriales bacterium]
MVHYLYILYSNKVDRYYVGESVDPVDRSIQHNEHLYTGSATSIANDWILQIAVICVDRSHARRLEKWIKSQKSRTTIKRMIEEDQYRNYQVDRFRELQ